jgi:methyl-accepting chemotaxis protein
MKSANLAEDLNQSEEVDLSPEVTQHLAQSVYQNLAVVEFSVDGVVIAANEVFCDRTGFGPGELKGQKFSAFEEQQTWDRADSTPAWEQVKKGKVFHGELRYTTKSGRDFWLSCSLSRTADGKRVWLVGTDISETKSELQIRKDIMNVTSIVSEANLRGDIMNCNDKFVETSQYSREELIGKPHNTTRHSDMPKEVFKELWGTIGRGKVFRGMVKNRKKDGTPYYVDAVIAPVIGENGKPRKYLGVRYDITETEIERQEMKGVLRAIDGAFAYIEFDTEGHVQKFNKNFQDTMGVTIEEVKGKHHRNFCDPTYVNTAEYQNFWPDLKSGKTKSGIFKRFDKSGREVYLQAVYSPVADEVGRVVKIIKIATNVTEQQKMLIAVQETANMLASSSAELTATATELSNNASSTSRESQAAAAAAEEVAAGVQTVATNIEEMVASIKEIGRSTHESDQMAKQTMAKAVQSNEIINKLGMSSKEIGEVIKVINSIAQQTNLLALNATIEAARAGEAGRGFAVVANEVKELAKQTAKATDDIAQKIGAIQVDTQGAVEAIGGISEAVEKLNSLSSVVATAIEEQTATTNEISRVVVESKKGVEAIAGTVKNVSVAADAGSASSGQTLTAAKELAQLAERLAILAKK